MAERDEEQQDDGIRSEDLGYGDGASPLAAGGLAAATTGAGSTNSPGGTAASTGAVLPTGTGMVTTDAESDGMDTPQTRDPDMGESANS